MENHVKHYSLDRKITLVKITQELSDYGGVREFTSEQSARANVQWLTGQESEINGKHQGIRALVFTIRYREGLKISDEVIYEGVKYDIERITEIGRHKYLALYCKVDS